MLFLKSLLGLALVLSVFARPAALDERGLDGVLLTDDVVLFDGAAFPDPTDSGRTLASLQSFVYLRQIDLGGATAIVSSLLSNFGIDVGDQVATLQSRIKLIAALGLPGKVVSVKVPGCSQEAKTQLSSLSDLGLSSSTVKLGRCENKRELTADVKFGLFDDRSYKASIFSAPDAGFGVISDIDDTVKISNVLSTTALIKSTFLEQPKPVLGMPQLYDSLSKSLNNPQFVYVTGSPFQIYPFLNDFLDSAYPSAKGPIFTQNLTVVDIPSAVAFLTNSNTRPYKVSIIDRLRSMYPRKKWLAIGDSTQQDPEVYAESLRKGTSISCIWIRKVEGANNTDARFASAFAGVQASQFRLFSDADIPTLSKIDVAGGKC